MLWRPPPGRPRAECHRRATEQLLLVAVLLLVAELDLAMLLATVLQVLDLAMLLAEVLDLALLLDLAMLQVRDLAMLLATVLLVQLRVVLDLAMLLAEVLRLGALVQLRVVLLLMLLLMLRPVAQRRQGPVRAAAAAAAIGMGTIGRSGIAIGIIEQRLWRVGNAIGSIGRRLLFWRVEIAIGIGPPQRQELDGCLFWDALVLQVHHAEIPNVVGFLDP